MTDTTPLRAGRTASPTPLRHGRAADSAIDSDFDGDGAVHMDCMATIATLRAQLDQVREHNTHLTVALHSNRDIGVAIGVLVARHLITADDAFQVLRQASQTGNRKLRDVARDVVDTGEIPGASSGALIAAQRAAKPGPITPARSGHRH